MKVKVNEDYYKFRLDTGATHGFVSSKIIAKHNLIPFSNARFAGTKMKFKDTALYKLPSLSVGGQQINGLIGCGHG